MAKTNSVKQAKALARKGQAVLVVRRGFESLPPEKTTKQVEEKTDAEG